MSLFISKICQNHIDAGTPVADNATFEGQHEEVDGGNQITTIKETNEFIDTG